MFTGDDGTTIPQGTILANVSTGDRFQTVQIGKLLQADCISCDYEVTNISDSTLYTITVNGGDYTFTSGIGATESEIVTGLVNAVNAPISKVWLAEEPADNLLRVRISTINTTNLVLNVQSDLTPERVTNNVQVGSLVEGPIRAPLNSITQVITAIGGVTSVTNTVALGTGRDRETDEAFRLRASQSLALAGSATIPALTAALLNVGDVSSAYVIENTDNVVVDGRPANSFECVVTAPTTTEVNEEVATVIWNDKPAGIQTHGNVSVPIVDTTGVTRVIKFSRPDEVFIAVRATYSLYDEETFPVDGPATIINTIVAYGSSLPVGKDVVPQRFYGPIYSAVNGIGDLKVECQTLASQGDTPVLGLWSEATIPVGLASISSFNVTDTFTVQE